VTFSVLARDPASGAIGMAVCSSSPAVGARCIHMRAGVGAVASQNVTNPALGSLGLDALASGSLPVDVIEALRSRDPGIAHRQLAILDASGRAAAFEGAEVLGLHAVRIEDGVIAAGNMLHDPAVIDAVIEGCRGSLEPSIEERMLAGLLAGLACGGEAGPIRSAAIAVVDNVSWRVTDLRVDDADEPLTELARLLTLWMIVKSDYRARALDPSTAPAFGVPGDE
jgi:uncharacterized Ntn-hydrolase superfamily protein